MKGVYVLLIDMKGDAELKIGSIGKIRFERGTYAYAGSAQNSIEKRVARHRSMNKKTFWHIDYMLKSDKARILKIFYKNASKREECRIAGFLKKSGFQIPGFGCSDCSCTSHLFRIDNPGRIEELGMKEL
jgi:Uri superfamily endonuclease